MLREYSTEFPDGSCYRWRALTWGEYKSIESQLERTEGVATWIVYDAVVALCLLDWDYEELEDLDEVPAGVVNTLGLHILETTGFITTMSAIQKRLDESRQRLGRYYHTHVATICHLFHYKPEEVENMDIHTFGDLLVLAEQLGSKIDPVETSSESKDQEVEMQTITGPDGKEMQIPIHKRLRTHGNKR